MALFRPSITVTVYVSPDGNQPLQPVRLRLVPVPLVYSFGQSVSNDGYWLAFLHFA